MLFFGQDDRRSPVILKGAMSPHGQRRPFSPARMGETAHLFPHPLLTPRRCPRQITKSGFPNIVKTGRLKSPLVIFGCLSNFPSKFKSAVCVVALRSGTFRLPRLCLDPKNPKKTPIFNSARKNRVSGVFGVDFRVFGVF